MIKKSPNKIIFFIFSFIFLFLIIGVGTALFLFNFYQSAPSEDATLYPFIITQGETVEEIGRGLENQGFIHHQLMFRYIVKKEGYVLQAGEFSIPKNLDVSSLAQQLTVGLSNTQITIIEGWRREEIAEYLVTTNLYNITTPEASENESFQLELRSELLNKIKEGYFYPETYTLSKNTSLSELVQIVNSTFDSQIDEKMKLQFSAHGLTLDEAVILASIVEREARTAESRAMVAGILFKRYQNGWPLEADATVQYAMADRDCVNTIDCTWWSKEIYEEDLAIDSPYNTRKYTGFPPTPICNPSLSSLQAVAELVETEYWFYLTGNDGKMHYAQTLEEHNQNILTYL